MFSVGLELHFRLNDEQSVFQAEIFKILNAIEAKAGGSSSEYYMIFVDIHAAIMANASTWCKSRLVDECKESLNIFAPDRSRLCWIPGHANAKLGLISGGDLVVGPDPQSAISTPSSIYRSEGKSRGVGEMDRVFMVLEFYGHLQIV